MSESPKRLAPAPQTLRELFLKSGNLCAFSSCAAILMNSEGTFIGQLCHIEAAERGGERFNAAMTNEGRRAASNLMLMCYEHHQITNDVQRYTTDVLRQMKATHELRFTSPDRATYELLAKAKWSTLLGAGVVAGAGLSGIARALRTFFGSSPSTVEATDNSIRAQLLQRLRLAPTGVVRTYTLDPVHAEVGTALLEIFREAGWGLENLDLTTTPIPENAKPDFHQSMLLLFDISKKSQVSNAQKAIEGFFDACGFTPFTREFPAERMEGERVIRLHIVVSSSYG